jgi:hypothetical protein
MSIGMTYLVKTQLCRNPGNGDAVASKSAEVPQKKIERRKKKGNCVSEFNLAMETYEGPGVA